MADVEEPTFPGLHLAAEHPVSAASSDPGTGGPIHAPLSAS